MHTQLFHQFAFAGNAIQIADQQDAQQKFGIDGRSPSIAVAVFQSLADEGEADVLINQPQQVVFGNVVAQLEVVKQGFRTGVLAHHDQQASSNEDHAVHGTILPCTAAHLLIRVTFSIPTPVISGLLVI
jgi:hypothetical protein